jgi:energy-coupling factor transporter ATP-binding protein EcfA2
MFTTIRRYSHIKNPDKRLDDIARKMDMSNLLQRKIKSLTPGELRWVDLAAKIAGDTKVLFIDEYEQHLGKEELKKLNNILYRKINYDGITLITTTQNKDLFNRLASVTITLENGRITSLRSFSKKKDNYRNKRRK